MYAQVHERAELLNLFSKLQISESTQQKIADRFLPIETDEEAEKLASEIILKIKNGEIS